MTNIKKANLFQVLALGINPYLSIITSLLYALKRSLNPFVFAFSIALISVYFPLMYDVSHSFFFYQDYKIGYLSEQLHAINELASVIDYIFNIDYFYTVFIIAFLSLYMWFKMFTWVVEKECSYELYLIVFVVFISLTTYKEILDLNRTYFSYMLSIFAIFSFHSKRISKALFVFLCILSFYFHPSVLIILAPYLISNFIRVNKVYGALILLFALMSGMLVDKFLFYFVGFLPESAFLSYLVSEKWGLYKSIEQGRILLWLVQFSIVVSLFFLFPQKSNKRLFTMFIFIVAIFFLFIKFRVFGERFFIAVALVTPIVLMSYKKASFAIYLLLISAVLKFLIYNVYVFGYVFTDDYTYVIENKWKREGNVYKTFYLPTPYLMAISEYGYSDSFILKYAKRREL